MPRLMASGRSRLLCWVTSSSTSSDRPPDTPNLASIRSLELAGGTVLVGVNGNIDGSALFGDAVGEGDGDVGNGTGFCGVEYDDNIGPGDVDTGLIELLCQGKETDGVCGDASRM